MLDWQGIKKFWTSPAVKKSVYIFAAIAAVMGVIMLIAVLASCGSTHYYTKVTDVSLIHRSTTKYGEFTRVYLVVANPTDKRKHRVVRCCDATGCVPDVEVIVAPRSDKKVTINTLSSVTCELLPSNHVE